MYGGQMKIKKVQIYRADCTCKGWSSKTRGYKHLTFVLDNKPHCLFCRRPFTNTANAFITIPDDAQKTPILQPVRGHDGRDPIT